MEDLKKIDSFFNDQKSFSKHGKETLSRRARILRFVRLALPSVAALLVGGVLIWPSLKDNTFIQSVDLTLPKKSELEKLHIEHTVFSVTDQDNKISTFTADSIDETEAGSRVLKMINPKGKIPMENNKIIDAKSHIGFYDQQNSSFRAVERVQAVYNQETTVLTEEALYDFKKSFGKGEKKVYAFGSWGKLWATGFEYDKTKNLLTLKGHSKIESGGRTLWADREIRYYQKANRVEAEGHVKILEKSSTVYADKMIAYFTDSSMQNLEKAETFGHVRIDTTDGSALGDYGIYMPTQSEMELQKNVSIMQNGNIIRGERAITNLKTSVSRILKSESTPKRVSGVIRGNTLKGQKHEK